MKTLENHMILYDAECPLCKIYTNAFVKTGMLDTGGRSSYQNKMGKFCPVIDQQRAVNEIALVDLKNGEVTYGIKSLFKIIGNAWPVFGPLFSFKPFVWLMSKIYAFISYNRRVIIPAKENAGRFALQPTFKKHYRIAYLLFTWFYTGFILTRYAHLLVGMVSLGNPLREYMICGGQIIFQGLVISTFAREKLWNYLGNMMTVSLGGALLLTPVLILGMLFTLNPAIYAEYFITVTGLMFFEHIRRVSLLNLWWGVSATWLIYRILILFVIFR